jgi:hypothetical protein
MGMTHEEAEKIIYGLRQDYEDRFRIHCSPQFPDGTYELFIDQDKEEEGRMALATSFDNPYGNWHNVTVPPLWFGKTSIITWPEDFPEDDIERAIAFVNS